MMTHVVRQIAGGELTTSTTQDTTFSLHDADPRLGAEITALSLYTDAPQTAPIRIHVDVAGVRQVSALVHVLLPWLWTNRQGPLHADPGQPVTLVIAQTATPQRVVLNSEKAVIE